MSKKNREEKKSLNKKEFKVRQNKKLSKKKLATIIIACSLVVLITGATITTAVIKKIINDRTVRIAFYGLSQEMCELIKEKIPEEEKVILDFNVISDSAFDASVVKQKYDMLFTWKGEITDYLAESSEDIPAKILETIPNSLRNKKCIPILLDHCELSFSQEVVNKLGETIPSNYSDFEKYLEGSKKYVFSPFFCNGADDRMLIDFIGGLVQAKAGLKAYNKFIDELKKAENLEQIIDADLGGFTLKQVLDMLKEWPKNGYTHPAWYNGRGNDLLYFAEDGQISVFFTLLSEHRKIPYKIIKNYESSFIPPNVSAANYGIIAPAVSCMLLTNNSNCKRYLSGFFTKENQEELSNKTKLAPVHYNAQAYDRQADDVRFWSASCAGGAIPDIYLAAFQRRPEALKVICAGIRNYLNKN